MKLAEKTVGEVKERVDGAKGVVENAKIPAADAPNNLERLFEDRVASALKQLGVPTRDDLQGIAQRLEELSSLLQTLTAERQTCGFSAPSAERDDLKQINGIGPILEGKLNAAGIWSYRQLAVLTDAEISHLESGVIKSSGRIRRDDWVGQAKDLYSRKQAKPL